MNTKEQKKRPISTKPTIVNICTECDRPIQYYESSLANLYCKKKAFQKTGQGNNDQKSV